MIASIALLAAAAPHIAYDVGIFGDDTFVPVVATRDILSSTLQWPRNTNLRVEEHEDELIVYFDQPVNEASVARFQAEAGAYVQSLRWNDQSLLLRPSAGVRASALAAKNSVSVAFANNAAVNALTADEQQSDGSDARDVAMVAIRADLASGFVGSARRQAEALAARYPDDRDVIRLMADTQAVDGDYRAAARHYRETGGTDLSARRTMALAPGSVSVAASIRDSEDFTQTELVASGNLVMSDTVAVAGTMRRIDTEATAAVVRDLLVADVDAGATVAGLALTARIAPQLQVDFSGDYWLDSSVAGGGVRLVYGSSDTQVRLGYAHHVPDFSFAEQALAGGFLSQATVGASAQILPELRGRLDLGWRRYGIAGFSNAGETITAAGRLDYVLLRRPVTLTIGYRLDAEYVQNLSVAPNGLARLPLANRENHTVEAFASGNLGPVLFTTGAGWTVDRYGGSGPNASVAAGLPVGTNWQIDAGLGLTSISRPGFPDRQTFGRLAVRRALGSGQ